MTTPDRLDGWRRRSEHALQACLDTLQPGRLGQAMRHAVLVGGKRLRPLLVHAAAHACGAEAAICDAPATAVELVHAYSLVHDDLPAMDDDALRRGQPTVHVAFDEATAILAGDALQALAFQHLATAAAEPDLRLAWLATLARACGEAGMCGGQALDMEATGRSLSLAELQDLHARKTGALIRASVRMGGLAAAIDADTLHRLDAYAQALGLAFQIRDDILDVEASSETLGKTAGKDAAQAKATYPALLGLDAARARLDEQTQAMRAALDGLHGDVEPLRALARLAVERQH